MRLSEIAEYVVKKYPDCCMACNNDVKHGCREEWYEEYLIDILMDFFLYEIVDMCGCGIPDYTHEVIRRTLKIRNDWQNNRIKYEEVQERYKNELNLDPKDELQYGSLQFILYKLDSCGILEHGSSIGGCWLTELGKMYLDVLNAWYERNRKETGE